MRESCLQGVFVLLLLKKKKKCEGKLQKCSSCGFPRAEGFLGYSENWFIFIEGGLFEGWLESISPGASLPGFKAHVYYLLAV